MIEKIFYSVYFTLSFPSLMLFTELDSLQIRVIFRITEQRMLSVKYAEYFTTFSKGDFTLQTILMIFVKFLKLV